MPTDALKLRCVNSVTSVDIDADFAAERAAGCSEGDHLCAVASDWSRRVASSSNTPGSPLMLIICSAALRASKLNRFFFYFYSVML